MQAIAGEHGCGGRLGTRVATDASLRDAPQDMQGSPALVFDHAAQFFTASDPWFQERVHDWHKRGWVHIWEGPVGNITPGGHFGSNAQLDSSDKWVATGGMRCLADKLAHEVTAAGGDIRRPCWVDRMTADSARGTWQLRGRGRDQGAFDAVVIAHNGKCADRLLRPAGVPQVAAQMRALKLSAVWVVMAAFEAPVQVPSGFEGAFVHGCDTLAWVANNTAKLRPSGDGIDARSTEDTAATLQCWTLISTSAFGKANKVPQERVPLHVAANVRPAHAVVRTRFVVIQ